MNIDGCKKYYSQAQEDMFLNDYFFKNLRDGIYI